MIPSLRSRALAACLAVLATLGAGGVVTRRGLAATAGDATVAIQDFAFGPNTITVRRGTKVTWTNNDDEPHTVVSDSDPKLWKSPPLDTDESFSLVFDKPGTYKYFCTIHPRMQGTVVVQ